MSDEAPLCVDLGLGLYADEHCIDPPRCQFWGYCLRCPETFETNESPSRALSGTDETTES